MSDQIKKYIIHAILVFCGSFLATFGTLLALVHGADINITTILAIAASAVTVAIKAVADPFTPTNLGGRKQPKA